MAGNGGRRPGAGRKPGGKNQRTAERAREAAQSGITPIEVMLLTMRRLYDEALAPGVPIADSLALLTAACEQAAKAAPYCHPRLANVEVSGPDGGSIEHTVTHTEREQRALDMLTVVRKRAKASN